MLRGIISKMKPMNPSGVSNFTQVLNSFFKTFVGNIGFGNPTAYDAAGNGTTFEPDNGNGILIRVGSITNPNNLPNFWAGNNTPTVITHNLNRRPVGFFVAGKDRACDIYLGNPPVATDMTITLYITVDTADTLLYIF